MTISKIFDYVNYLLDKAESKGLDVTKANWFYGTLIRGVA